jgi:hypothetical protein
MTSQLSRSIQESEQAQRGSVANRALALVAVLGLIAAACGGSVENSGLGDVVGAPTTVAASAPTFTPSEPPDGLFDLGDPVDASGAVGNFSTTAPDFTGAIPGDDATAPLALGTINQLPGEDYLNFLFEFCQPQCYRDAHFMDSNNPQVGSGIWTADRPFHVRHGFINTTDQPLGEGFDVVMYLTRWDGPKLDDGTFEIGQTYRFTSDYVLQGESDQCGPTYKTQTEPTTCEWFIHDFANGIPDGRYDIWTVWQAPCQAWQDIGFTDTCNNPTEVISLFSSGVNSPFDNGHPSFTEHNEAQLSAVP